MSILLLLPPLLKPLAYCRAVFKARRAGRPVSKRHDEEWYKEVDKVERPNVLVVMTQNLAADV